VSQNCDCSDTTGYRTLAQLRTELFTRLGFVDPLANVATRTLVLLRADLARRLGYAAQVAAGSYPAGVADELDGYINEAQQTLWRRMELDKGAVTLPARMTADADPTTLDYSPVLNLALGMVKANKGHADSKLYIEMAERYLSDVANRRPPNAEALCEAFLQDAQRQLIRRYAAVRLDRWFTWSLVAGERFYDFDADDQSVIPAPTTADITVTRQLSGGLMLDQRVDFQFSWVNADGETVASALFVVPTTLSGETDCSYKIDWTLPEIDDCLSPIVSLNIYVKQSGDAGLTLWFTRPAADLTYTLTGSVIPVGGASPPTTNTTQAPATTVKTIDTLALKWVGAVCGSRRYPLAEGIPPSLLDTAETGNPRYYQVRQCLEIWPAPAESSGTLELRAGFKANRFSEDADLPSVDDQLVFLLALANGKAHFKRPDAALVLQEFEVHLSNVVAGSHGVTRYVPGRSAGSAYVEPVPTVPFE
jgi:hypothetical protein